MNISVAIPTVNRADLLEEAALPLLKHWALFVEFLIIDNGRQTFSDVIEQNALIWCPESNLGFSGSCNLAIKEYLLDADCDWLLLHSDDVRLTEQQVAGLPDLCEMYADKWLLRSRASFSVFLISRAGAEAMGNAHGQVFDERMFVYFSDLDLEWRMRLADPTKIVNDLRELYPKVYRRKSSTRKDPSLNTHRQDRAWFLKKWGGVRRKDRLKEAAI